MIFPRLRDCRQDCDLTQAQVASMLGIDQRVYSSYETGNRTMPIEYFITLAQYYQTSIDFLVGLTNESQPYPK